MEQAGWSGTLFAVDPQGEAPRAIGILFRDEAAGRKIFPDLIARLGTRMTPTCCASRSSRATSPAKKPGYSVYIGTECDNYVAELKREGAEFTNLLATMVGRYHRMNPAPGSPFLPGFKKAFEKHKKYMLIPAFGDPTSPRPEFALAIWKRQINFLRTEKLGENDVERVVMMRDGESYRRDCDAIHP